MSTIYGVGNNTNFSNAILNAPESTALSSNNAVGIDKTIIGSNSIVTKTTDRASLQTPVEAVVTYSKAGTIQQNVNSNSQVLATSPTESPRSENPRLENPGTGSQQVLNSPPANRGVAAYQQLNTSAGDSAGVDLFI